MDDVASTVNKLLTGCEAESIEVEARIRRQLVTRHSVRLLVSNLGVDWTTTRYSEKKKISKNNRKCTYRQRVEQSRVTTICKSSISRTDVNDLWCAVHVSVETLIPSMVHALDTVAAVDVLRRRALIDGHYVDVVESDEPRVEVEVADAREFLDAPDARDTFVRIIERVCTVLQGNESFLGYYDWKMVMHIASTTYRSANGRSTFCVEKKQYQKPRTMTAHVLFAIAENVDDWVVTPKVDGVRRFLVSANRRVFSLGVAKEVAYEGKCEYEGVTVQDCEYANNVYHVFGIPVWDGHFSGDMNRYVQLVKSSRVKTYEKFASFDMLQKLYETFTENYNMDGLIFYNMRMGYMQNVPKWKTHSTVDLEVSDGGELLTCDGYRFKMTCTNTVMHPGIWEFSCDKERSTVTALRPRPDKIQANSMHIIFKNIWHSVPGTIFTGRGFYLMRKYHNRVKRRSIVDANDAGSVILDVGTGQGGDVDKWSRASAVYCVEPSVESTQEMYDRYGRSERITVINEYLRDLDLEKIQKKIDIFTAFFCMNQWSDGDWDKLVEAVRTKGSKKCRLLAIAMTDPMEHRSDHLEIVMRGDDRYNIKMHDTRIMDIDETAVSLDKMEKYMGKCRMGLVKRDRLNDNDFMTKEERRLSAMYTLFVYSFKKCQRPPR